MRLHRYFGRRFLVSFFGVFAIFAAFLALLDLVDQLRRFDTEALGLANIVGLTLLKVPGGLYEILPLITILATIALFLSLARSSELVVTRAAGRSGLRSLLAPVGMAILLGAGAVAVMNPIVAATSQRYEALVDQYSGGGRSVLSLQREGLWLREGGRQGQTVIRAARADLDGTELQDVSFLLFDRTGLPVSRIEGDRATLANGAWRIENAKTWSLDGANPERLARTDAALVLPSTLSRSQIRDSFGTPSAIPIWELPGFIDRLERAGFSARQHRVWFQMELAQPVFLAAMVLIGAGFTMRHTRFGGTGLMVLLAVVSGFAVYFVRNFGQVFAESGQLPVELAAWGPPIAAVLLPLGLLLHLEDG